MADGSDLFKSLKGMGFNDLSNVSLYNEDKSKEREKKNTTQPAVNDSLYDKRVDCPICGKQTTVRNVKTSSVRVMSRDTDFMTYYQDPNPMSYDAWVCVQCGYAPLSSRFKAVNDKQVKLIKENISSKWNPNRKYPQVYDVDTAIEIHQLALLNTVVEMWKGSEKAYTCLKLAWLYRLKKDGENEYKFLYQAQKGFIIALEKESPPIAGLDEASLEYLIGEISRRLDNVSSALKWFGRVLSNTGAKPKIKKIARDQKDLIHDEQNKDKGKFIV